MRLPAMFCKKIGNMYVANNSSILQYYHGMSIRTTEYANSWEGGGGLNCEAKAHVLIVPPPLFFLEVGRKKGGRNSGAVRYKYRGQLGRIAGKCTYRGSMVP